MCPLTNESTFLMNIQIYFTDVQDEDPRKGTHKVQKTEEGKVVTMAIKFNNNTLTDMTGISDVISNMLFDPTVLSSVDLSFNDITKIGQVRKQLSMIVSFLAFIDHP